MATEQVKDQYLLVLGAGIMQVPLIQAIKARGLGCLCFDANPQAPGRAHADDFDRVDISQPETVLKSTREWNGRRPLRGVLTVGTDFTLTVSLVGTAMGWAVHEPETARRVTHKGAMRQALRKTGLLVPRFCSFKEEDLHLLEAQDRGLHIPVRPEFMDQEMESLDSDTGFLPFPFVLKPAGNMGARGVQLIRNLADWDREKQGVLVHSRGQGLIVEEYIPGPEFSLDGILWDEKEELFGFADRWIDLEPGFVELGHEFPSLAPAEIREQVVKTFFRGARALGITRGAAKGDMKYSPSGPVIGEIAGRLSGGFMSGWTYPLHSGRSAMDSLIDIALGRAPQWGSEKNARFVKERALISLPGTLEAWGWLEDVDRNLEHLDLEQGKKLSFPRNNVEKLGNFIVSGETEEETQEKVRSVQLSFFHRLRYPDSRTEAFFRETDAYPPWSFRDYQSEASWLQALPPTSLEIHIRDTLPETADCAGESRKSRAGILCLRAQSLDLVRICLRDRWEQFRTLSNRMHPAWPGPGNSWNGPTDSVFWYHFLKGGVAGALYHEESLIRGPGKLQGESRK